MTNEQAVGTTVSLTMGASGSSGHIIPRVVAVNLDSTSVAVTLDTTSVGTVTLHLHHGVDMVVTGGGQTWALGTTGVDITTGEGIEEEETIDSEFEQMISFLKIITNILTD